MASRKQSMDLQTSLRTMRQINWSDAARQMTQNINKKLLDQCADIIQQFINDEQLMPMQEKSVQKKARSQSSKRPGMKQGKPKARSRSIKSEALPSAKTIRPNKSMAIPPATHGYPCYPSAFPCFRFCGPIKCPSNKLPMPRDLWYRIVCSQALETQIAQLPVPSKRKLTQETSSEHDFPKNKSNANHSSRQQTMNAAASFTSFKMLKLSVSSTMPHHTQGKVHPSKSTAGNSVLDWNVQSHPDIPLPGDCLDYLALTLPLKLEEEFCETRDLGLPITQIEQNMEPTHIYSSDENRLWIETADPNISPTSSSHIARIDRPPVHHGRSADIAIDQFMPVPSAPSVSLMLDNPSSVEMISLSNRSEQHKPTMTSKRDWSPSSSFDHPLLNDLVEYYHLTDIPRQLLLKRLHRRWVHTRQSIENMSSDEIEIKLKYKRDALDKKRQTAVSSMTKDERLTMAELELNVFEYVQGKTNRDLSQLFVDVYLSEALDNPPSPLVDESTIERYTLPVAKSTVPSEASILLSVSTMHTGSTISMPGDVGLLSFPVPPSAISQSMAMLSTTTHLSDKTEKFATWTHPMLNDLLAMFEPLTTSRRSQIQKKLARRCEHIGNKAKELNEVELQKQIDSKSKALAQSQTQLQMNDDERLRIAELKLSLYELQFEQSQRSRTGSSL